MNRLSRVLSLILCAVMLVALAACGAGTGTSTPPASAPAEGQSSEAAPESGGDGPITIKYLTFRVGVHPEAASFAEMIEEFNRQHEGVYKVEIEEGVPEVMEFMQKLNMLFAAGDLPVIVDPLMQDVVFAEKLFDSGMCVDFAPYLEADPEWKARLIPSSLEAQTREDGTIYSLPVACYSAIGIYYIKDLFAQAGVDTFPETWDEMYDALEKLQDIGVPGFMFETGANAWHPSLVLCSLISRTEEGREFMRTKLPTNFNIPAVIDALADMQRLYQYAAPNSIGAATQDTTNAFVNGHIAMQPNGPWHLPAMYPDTAPEGFADSVGVAMYPGNIMLDHDSLSYNVAVVNTYSDEEIEAAMAVCKFFSSDWYVHKQIRDRAAATPFAEPTDEDIAAMTPVAVEYVNLISSGKMEHLVPCYHVNWDSVTVNENIGKYFPQLFLGEITPEEMATLLSESAQYYVENVG